MTYVTSEIVEVCVFKIEGGTPVYLLLHRTKEEAIYPDLWQFVSGSIEKGEKAVEAALRELAEETHLVPTALWVVPRVLSFFDARWDAVNLVPFFAAQVDIKSTPILSMEHREFDWFPLEPALQKLIWPEWREGLHVIHDCIVGGHDLPQLTRVR